MKNLKDIHYDAFISYRHLEPDSFVAQTLHKRLEAIKLPRSVSDKAGSGKTKIERIFRDEEELSLSEDLSEPINNALANSDFLVCICTPKYLESRWCMREIEVFLQTHKRDHILVVLAEGEPADAFPEILTIDEVEVRAEDGSRRVEKREIEPLAADTRGETKKEIIKKMNTAVLRISAAIFGMNYDDLRQRHREAKLKRMMAFGGCIGAVVLAFAVFATVALIKISGQNAEISKQNLEISEQNLEISKQKDTISSQYDELQDKYADQVALSAVQTLGEGRREDAIRDLNSVLPESKDKAYNVNVMRTLYDALNIYGIDGKHVPSRIFENDTDIVSFDVSADGRYLLIVGYSCIRVYDSESGDILCEIEKNSKAEEEEVFYAVFCGSKGFLVIDGKKREYYPIADGMDSAKEPVALPEEIDEYTPFYQDADSGLTIVLGTDALLGIGESGRVEYRMDIAEILKKSDLEITGVSFEKKYAVASYKDDERIYMVVFDKKSGKPVYHCSEKENYSVVAAVYGNTLCYVASDVQDDTMKTEAVAVDIRSGKQKWKTYLSDQTVVEIDRNKNLVYAIGGSSVTVLNTSGKLLTTYNTESAIVTTWADEDGFYYLCQSGDLFSCDETLSYKFSDFYFQYPPTKEVSMVKHVNDVLYYAPTFTDYIVKYAPEISEAEERIGEEYTGKEYYEDPGLREGVEEITDAVEGIDPGTVAEAFFSSDKKYLCVYGVFKLYIIDVENRRLLRTLEAKDDEYDGMRYSEITGGYIIDTRTDSFLLDSDFNITCKLDRIVDEDGDGFTLQSYAGVYFRVPYVTYDKLAELVKQR